MEEHSQDESSAHDPGFHPALAGFHPAVQAWLSRRYAGPTLAQELAWPQICQGGNVLVAAPTGSGKTLCAFLDAIDKLVRRSIDGRLGEGTVVLYVSPLKALSRDIEQNLQAPLTEIANQLGSDAGLPIEIRTAVRTGDTPQGERAKQARHPAHILVTTPESLYILLTSESGRKALSSVETVIVDEIHAMVRDKRGAHLSLSLARLDALLERSGRPCPQRIGLSATQKPIEEIAAYLSGFDKQEGQLRSCTIVDVGHSRPLDLDLCVPDEPLTAVMSAESWESIYDQVAALVQAHKTTLVFLNTRRLVERVGRFLSERLGKEIVETHHGSLSKERRFLAEQKLKAGDIKVLVASASMELGIDVGDVELVCQLGSPRSISTFLQRVGRSGHFIGGLPKGRLFPLSRDDLVECVALLGSLKAGQLDLIQIPEQPLDILAQQIVAAAVAEEWQVRSLFALFRQAAPFKNLTFERFSKVVQMLADGFATARGRRGALIHFDAVGQRIKARRRARIIATTNGGAIADNFDFDVLLAPQDIRVGSVHEDFAIESSPGDVFQLGNTSYQIQKVEGGRVIVTDAHGAPPTLPFWLGEAPGRTAELSLSVSRLRKRVAAAQSDSEWGSLAEDLKAECGLAPPVLAQLLDYLRVAHTALGHMPTQEIIVAERFFDDASNMHVVIHSPFGTRVNRAFGLALRKRFCRSFNVELQAAANDDAIVMSLGPMHSFPLDSIFSLLNSKSAEDVLVQALLDAPLFGTRFRWNASRALAVSRFRSGKRVPPKFQRIESDDLLAVCFPDQVACLENIGTHREIPDHPLVEQTIHDCLHEAMDVDGLLSLLRGIEDHSIQVVARDLTEPSPLSHEVLNARPYAFLDDAPLEERRTQAIQMRHLIDPESASDLAALNPLAIKEVILESAPNPRDEDELHDALLVFGFLTEDEQKWPELAETLIAQGRAHKAWFGSSPLLFATERTPWFLPLVSEESIEPPLDRSTYLKRQLNQPVERSAALVQLARSRLELAGPTTVSELASPLRVSSEEMGVTLSTLEAEGFVLRGKYRPGAEQDEYCERRLLARIHRLTLNRLRKEIEPVSHAQFVDFLTHYQGLQPAEQRRGIEGTRAVIAQLSGYWAAAQVWESSLLAGRIRDFRPEYLDQLSQQGQILWRGGSGVDARNPRFSPASSVSFSLRQDSDLNCCLFDEAAAMEKIGTDASKILETLAQNGALFLEDIRARIRLLPSQLEAALGELIAAGLVTCDSLAGVRYLLTSRKRAHALPSGRRSKARKPMGLVTAGRFSKVRVCHPIEGQDDERAIRYAWGLLDRWGVVFKKILEREQLLMPWSELRRVFSLLEARGEIRGGRFVSHISGEQFATKEAIALMRQVRRDGPSPSPIWISAYDPLNLTGILGDGTRFAKVRGNQLAIVGGCFVASYESGKVGSLVGDTEFSPVSTEALSAILSSHRGPRGNSTHLSEKVV